MGKKKGIMQRTDIPYAERIQMQRRQEIAFNREQAARIVLQLACVALNDTEGLGYYRITRFAKRLNTLVNEYYDQPDVEDVHLKERLSQMGFLVEGDHIYAAERDSDGKVVPAKLLKEGKTDGK